MGLLDDAIREHLELKRRRGADTNEIERQEQEAFGPPRRGELELDPAHAHADEPAPVADHATFEPAQAPPPAPTALHAVEDPGMHDEPIVHAHEAPHVQDEPPRPHGDPADALTDRPEAGQTTQAFSAEDVRAATSPPPSSPPATPPPAADLDAERPRAVPDDPPRPAADPVPPAPEPAASTPPAPEPAAPATPRPAEEDSESGEEQDVLEETPEFLQETPEHDRLWFEQRPPRDFDF